MKHKTLIILAMVFALMVAGCEYEAPFSEPQGLKIDKDLLGLWVAVDEDSEEAAAKEAAISFLEFTDTDYLVCFYGEGKEAVYYRGYPVALAGGRYIQFQVLGSNERGASPDERKYGLLKCEVVEDELKIWYLNPKVISKDLKTTEELKAAFIENKDNEELFELLSPKESQKYIRHSK